ncbi:MAG: hypothetical protein J6A08_06975 [Lachnospiraceae bacterium]|nr:hypothetical protein [Lachnospiraceae bacterium]
MNDLEKEELLQRVRNMNAEEQRMAASRIESQILFEELMKRNALMEKKQELFRMVLDADSITRFNDNKTI